MCVWCEYVSVWLVFLSTRNVTLVSQTLIVAGRRVTSLYQWKDHQWAKPVMVEVFFESFSCCAEVILLFHLCYASHFTVIWIWGGRAGGQKSHSGTIFFPAFLCLWAISVHCVSVCHTLLMSVILMRQKKEKITRMRWSQFLSWVSIIQSIPSYGEDFWDSDVSESKKNTQSRTCFQRGLYKLKYQRGPVRWRTWVKQADTRQYGVVGLVAKASY